MKILAIDSSAIVASVAVVEDEKLICEYTINHKKTHSQTLMPMIDEITKSIELDLKTIDVIAVSSGPGSFTGLRIGAATAKGLAQVLNVPIASVPTLDALAYNIVYTDRLICPIMDARRNQVYTALYKWENNEFKKITEYMAVEIESIIDIIDQLEREVIFLGDGVDVHKKVIEQKLKTSCLFASSNNNMQRAASIARLAIDISKEGKLIDATNFVPFYLRKSQAERELESRS